MELKEKIGEVVEKGRETVGIVADRARETVEIASLKSEIATCEKVRQKNYTEIGKLYYESCGKLADSPFQKQCAAIFNAEKAIEDLQKKIDDLKSRNTRDEV